MTEPGAARELIRPPRSVGPAGTRTWTHRGRLSPLTAERINTLGPARELPPPEPGGSGPLDLAVVFGRTAPVMLEIGCGHGRAAIAYAQAFPEWDVIAVDVHTPGIARMLADAEREGVANLRIHRGDAELLISERLAPGSISAVHLFFPDPWPKAKHAKRRFVAPARLDLLDRVLAPGGRVLIATDQQFYADHATAQVSRHGRFVATVTPRPEWRPSDGFEAKGIAAGRSIVDLQLRRSGEPGDRGSDSPIANGAG